MPGVAEWLIRVALVGGSVTLTRLLVRRRTSPVKASEGWHEMRRERQAYKAEIARLTEDVHRLAGPAFQRAADDLRDGIRGWQRGLQ